MRGDKLTYDYVKPSAVSDYLEPIAISAGRGGDGPFARGDAECM